MSAATAPAPGRWLFAKHHMRSPKVMGEREIRQFLLHLVEEAGCPPRDLPDCLHIDPPDHRSSAALMKFVDMAVLIFFGMITRV